MRRLPQERGRRTVCRDCSTACYPASEGLFSLGLDHVASGFPTTCENCQPWTHGSTPSLTTSRSPATRSPGTCHGCRAPPATAKQRNSKGTPADCFTCHTKDFTSRTIAHVQLNLPTTAPLATRQPTGSMPSSTTRFTQTIRSPAPTPTLACTQCHVNNNYVATPTACYSCHQADFTGTQHPNHVAAGFPTDCSLCPLHHGLEPRQPSITRQAHFRSPAPHITVPARRCHVNDNYTTVPTDCYSCHTADYTEPRIPIT